MSFPRYPRYKDSGVKWLGEVPEQWQVRRLKNIAADQPFAIVDGPFGTQLKAEDYRETGVPLVRIGNLSYEGRFSSNDLVYIDPSKAAEVGRSSVRRNDIIIGKTGATIGKSAIFDQFDQGIIASSCLKISPDASQVLTRMLLYTIVSGSFQETLVNESGGSTRDTINITPFGNLYIAIPSLLEQSAIVAFLDCETAKIDSLVVEQRRLIELLKEKRQAVIAHAVTKGLNPHVPMKPSGIEWLGDVPEHWAVTPIKNFCYVNDGNHGEEYPKESDSASKENGVPFIRAGDFEDFKIVEDDLRYISREKNDSMRKGNLQENDILFVNRGATIGKIGVIDCNYIGANLNSQIAYLRVEESRFSHRYLMYYLSGTFIQETIVAAVHGGALPQYPIKNILNLIVCCPVLAEQLEIAAALDREVGTINGLTAEAERAIDLLQERRTALISAAVTGKIDVRRLAESEAA